MLSLNEENSVPARGRGALRDGVPATATSSTMSRPAVLEPRDARPERVVEAGGVASSPDSMRVRHELVDESGWPPASIAMSSR